MNSFKVKKSEVGKRLDLVLSERYGGKSRSYWSKAITKKHVTVNSDPVKSGHKLAQNDRVIIQIPESVKKPIDVPIIYEDDSVVVIDKPEGLLVHDKDNFSNEFTVVDFMADKYTGKDSRRNGVVHRLDRTTSGVMICAKNDEVATELQTQFADRSVEKKYLSICSGHAKQEEAIIDLPIERNPKEPIKFRVHANGKPSSTKFRVIEEHRDLTKLELVPRTGRTHQLRVHLAYIGMPILGDEMYGGKPARRVMLHAHKLVIGIPGVGRKEFISEPPEDFGYE